MLVIKASICIKIPKLEFTPGAGPCYVSFNSTYLEEEREIGHTVRKNIYVYFFILLIEVLVMHRIIIIIIICFQMGFSKTGCSRFTGPVTHLVGSSNCSLNLLVYACMHSTQGKERNKKGMYSYLY